MQVAGIELGIRNTSVKNMASSFTKFTFWREQKADPQVGMCLIAFYVLIKTYAPNAKKYIVSSHEMAWDISNIQEIFTEFFFPPRGSVNNWADYWKVNNFVR